MARRKNSRAASGAGSIRQRSDGTWEARFVVGTNPATGKLIRKSVYGKTQADVRKKMTEKLQEVDNGIYKEPARMTVAEWLDAWLETYTGNLKERSRIMYAGYIGNRIKPAMGAVKLDNLTSLQIQRFYNGLLEGEKPLSPKTIKNIHGILHKALKQAVILDYIRVNPCDSCTLPRIEPTEIQPFTQEEIKAFLSAIRESRYEAFYIIALFTGMRQGELLGLSWRQVDFEQGTIFIDQQMQIVGNDYCTLVNDVRLKKERFVN